MSDESARRDEFTMLTGQSLYYDRAGNPTDFAGWSLDSEVRELEVGTDLLMVARKPVLVSTVWTGLYAGRGPGGRPLIFETMVFRGPLDGYRMRYATEEDAKAGHAEIVDFHISGWRNRLRFRCRNGVRRVISLFSEVKWSIRRPSKMRYARVNVGLWTFALLTAVIPFGMAIGAGIEPAWLSLLTAAFDIWMLKNAIEGYRWRRQQDVVS